jgi:hypothetical protein
MSKGSLLNEGHVLFLAGGSLRAGAEVPSRFFVMTPQVSA